MRAWVGALPCHAAARTRLCPSRQAARLPACRFLILIASVAAALVLAVCVYILVEYTHPEDRNQAWIPKIVVVFGMSLAMWSILLFPLDVANTQACSTSITPSSCTLTLPMHQLWYAVFISNLVMVYFILPFTLFFYEADSD